MPRTFTRQPKYTLLRMLVEIGLLVTVWFQAHWSVALVLSLLAVRAELWDLKHGTLDDEKGTQA